MKYVKNLRFDDEPDYGYMTQRLKNAFEKNSLIYDNKFDWVDYGLFQEKTSAFLFLSKKQQEFSKADLVKQRKMSDSSKSQKKALMLNVPGFNAGRNEQSLFAVNRNSYAATPSHKESHDKIFENAAKGKSQRHAVPLISSNGNEDENDIDREKLKRNTVRCTCLIL